MKLVIHPEYAEDARLVEDIIDGRIGSTLIHSNRRNTVSLVDVNGRRFVVKRFHPRTLFHRFLYAWLRRTKARRAYDNAGTLIGMGIGTAAPVAYAEIRSRGLLRQAVFVSDYVDGGLVVDIYNQAIDRETREELMVALGRFTRRLHDLGLQPLDYNPGNIFYRKGEESEDGGYSFSVIDINRMVAGRVPGMARRMMALSQLGVGLDQLGPVLRGYFGDAGDTDGVRLREAGASLILKIRRREQRSKKIRHAIASIKKYHPTSDCSVCC